MSRLLTALATAVFALALLCFPQAGADAARTGLALCGESILPALFPYFVLANLVISQGIGARLARLMEPVMSPLFHIGGYGGTALALGLAGGYPTGAAAVRGLLEEGVCSVSEAQSLLNFCNNSGPAFILAVAGTAVYGQVWVGFFLLAVHILGALGTGLLLRRRQKPSHSHLRQTEHEPPSAGTLLTDAVKKALRSSLQVCAYVVLFQVMIGLVRQLCPVLNGLPAPISAMLMGLLELSSGVCALTGSGATPLSLTVCAFLLGWGGCSIHCQTAALLEGTDLRMGPYLGGKLLHGLLSAGLCLAGTSLFPQLFRAVSTAGKLSLANRFPLSVPAGWALWAAAAFFLLKKGGNAGANEVQ